MPLVDDSDVRAALAPLRNVEPTEDAVSAVLAAARAEAEPSRRPPSWRRPPRWRLAAGLATATAVTGVVLTALPGSSPTPESTRHLTGVALLRTASAAAADQPEPPTSAGYRYAEVLDRWRFSTSNAPSGPDGNPVRGTEETVEIEQRVETWVSRDDWSGRRLAHRGRVIEGEVETGSASACDPDRPVPLPARCEHYDLLAPSDAPYGYGGEGEAVGPIASNVDVAELPTEAKALRKALLRAYRSDNWAPGLPTREQERYDLVHEVLILLESANTAPDLRAALWGVLALTPGVEAAPAARDPLGRSGEAVAISTRNGGVITVIFDSRTSELLFWSERGTGDGTPDQSHTMLRAGHVEATGERPPR